MHGFANETPASCFVFEDQEPGRKRVLELVSFWQREEIVAGLRQADTRDDACRCMKRLVDGEQTANMYRRAGDLAWWSEEAAEVAGALGLGRGDDGIGSGRDAARYRHPGPHIGNPAQGQPTKLSA